MPKCDTDGCSDITVRNENFDGIVTITKMSVTINEASIRVRPFTIVVFRQLMDSQHFLPDSRANTALEIQRLDNAVTSITPADNEKSLKEIEVSH